MDRASADRHPGRNVYQNSGGQPLLSGLGGRAVRVVAARRTWCCTDAERDVHDPVRLRALAALLSADGDTIEDFNGWSDYIVTAALLRCDERERRPLGERMAKLGAIRRRVISAATRRRAAEPGTCCRGRVTCPTGTGAGDGAQGSAPTSRAEGARRQRDLPVRARRRRGTAYEPRADAVSRNLDAISGPVAKAVTHPTLRDQVSETCLVSGDNWIAHGLGRIPRFVYVVVLDYIPRRATRSAGAGSARPRGIWMLGASSSTPPCRHDRRHGRR